MAFKRQRGDALGSGGLGLIDRSQYDPALPSGHPFANVQSLYYWSSTTFAGTPANAWYVRLTSGVVD